MGFHYKFSASSSHRWLNCPGSKALEKTAPIRKTGLDALTGTAAHYLAEWALNHGYATQVTDALVGARIRINPDGDAVQIVCGPNTGMGNSFSGIAFDEDADHASKKYPTVIRVDEKMVKAVAVYTNLITSIIDKYGGTATLNVESGFKLAPDMGGMSDTVIVAPGKIIVIDYKNGHNPVGATDNAQLAMYGVGAMNTLAGAMQINEVLMCIVQPNGGSGPPVKKWSQTRGQMIQWRDKFEQARQKCIDAERLLDSGQSIDTQCVTGSHCKWCPSMVHCPQMKKQTMALARKSINDLSAPTMPQPNHLEDNRLLWVAEHGDAIVEFIGRCKEHMTDQAISKGKVWKGLKLVESQTKRKLIDKDALTSAFKKRKLTQAFEPKLKSISKLEKIFGEDKMSRFIEKPKGALKLVPDTDDRDSMENKILALLPELPEE